MNSKWIRPVRFILFSQPVWRCWQAVVVCIVAGLGLGTFWLWLTPFCAHADLGADFVLVGSDEMDTRSMAWGDWDGDGDLDLAVGNHGQVNQVYENDGGTLKLDPANGFGWESPDEKKTASVAWGDWDEDGDLDLAVGNNDCGEYGCDRLGGDVNQVYENDGGTLKLDPADGLGWQSTGDAKHTLSVAWGDWDGDGDLDLAVGNHEQVNQVYENDGGTLKLDPANGFGWESPDEKKTASVAWGDWDEDGDLDLAVGNNDCGEYGCDGLGGDVNQVYENDAGTLKLDPADGLGWQSTGDEKNTLSVAWGDWDEDGDLDLAVGNLGGSVGNDGRGQENQVYENEGGTLKLDPASGLGWVSPEDDEMRTNSVAWGDWDGDGDLDLAIGNVPGWYENITWGGESQVYENDNGVLRLDLASGFGWESLETNDTHSVAWGDWDGDGDLDLAVGNDGGNLLYRNESGMLALDPDRGLGWQSPDEMSPDRMWTTSVAWGDWDGDGDLDLVIGNDGAVNQVYEDEGGTLKLDPANGFGWESPDEMRTTSVAWGDWDGDGDLDLAVGNDGEVNQVYENDGGMLELDPANGFGWESPDEMRTYSVAWGDWDGDGDLDLAVGNDGVNQIYENEGGALRLDPGRGLGWQSPDRMGTTSVAWGDWDGDGDLDLAVGNNECDEYGCDGPRGDVNQVYENDGRGFNLVWWSEGDKRPTMSVAWGDWDGDGDLDLAIGNYQRVNQVYENEGGTLELDPANGFGWVSPDEMRTYSVAWGDWDGDGDLDLTIGNGMSLDWEVNQVYENDGGTLRLNPGRGLGWQSPDRMPTASVAWGDWDEDGDLDLAVGNAYEVNQVYENLWLGSNYLVNNPAGAVVHRPGDTHDAFFFSMSRRPATPTLSIPFTLFDAELDRVSRVRGYYSVTGGGQWFPAVTTADTVTAGLRTGSLARATSVVPIRDGGTVSSTLIFSGAGQAHNLELALTISHTRNSQLTASLWAPWPSPTGTTALLFDGVGGSGAGFHNLVLRDRAARSIAATIGATAPVSGTYRPVEPLSCFRGAPLDTPFTLVIADRATGETGSLQWWTLKSIGATHVYTWDTFRSGFFGQSDNVVLRLDITGLTGPFQRAKATVYSPPFRVRGTQVRVYSETVADTTVVSNALVYRLPAGQIDGAEPLADRAGQPFRTDHLGYLQGRGTIGIRDTLFALLPVSTTVAHEGELTFDGVDDYVVRNLLHNAPITATTVSFWMRSDDTTGSGTPFSYASPITDSTLLIANYNDFTIHRGDGLRVTTGISATDGAWNHIAVTWRSQDGQVKLYKNGVSVYTATLAPGVEIPPGGSLVLGRDQNGTGFFRGSLDEVRIWSVARTQDEIQGDMDRHLRGDEAGLVAYWPFDDPDTTTSRRCRDQTASGNDGTLYGPIWVGDSLGGYTLYHTSARPTPTGLAGHMVEEPGVQVLTVTSRFPLILFDLNVSLEWDARKDALFMEQLKFDLLRASEFLYDWTDGQAALGTVTVYHDGERWNEAHVRIYASNRLHPNADLGGMRATAYSEIVTGNPLAPTDPYTVTYVPGQVRIGATWNRYGESSGALGEDWPLALAHELGHYAFYLDDNYLGFDDQTGVLIPVEGCPGAMADTYRSDYSEFHPGSLSSGGPGADLWNWERDCLDTLAARSTGRWDWRTIVTFYPWLRQPAAEILSGPSSLPLAVTRITVITPAHSIDSAIEVPVFYLFKAEGGRYLPGESARAFLYQNDATGVPVRLIDLGVPTLDRVHARGARPGDRLCVYDPAAGRLGCERIEPGDDGLMMVSQPDWQPEVIVSPVNSTTVAISVLATGIGELSAGAELKARLFPADAPFAPALPISLPWDPAIERYANTFTPDGPVVRGYVQVWVAVEGAPEPIPREIVTSYALGGNPAFAQATGGRRAFAQATGGRRAFAQATGGRRAPAASPDGQVFLFGQDLNFPEGEFYALQAATIVPAAPPWATIVGCAYRLLRSPGAPPLDNAGADNEVTSISFQYLEREVPPGEESWLQIYFLDEGRPGASWQLLKTVRSTAYNVASALTQGEGLYALMSSVEIPLYQVGWNLFSYPVQATRPVSEALLSIDDFYSIVYGYEAEDTADPWKVYGKVDGEPAPDWVNDLEALEFGRGYWIHVSEAITLYLRGGSAPDVTAASGFPSPPATYYGAIVTDTGFIPVVGTAVTARVNGNLCGQARTQLQELDGRMRLVYVMDVLADDGGEAAGCGAPGRVVTFEVGGWLMATDATWDNTQVSRWDLGLDPSVNIRYIYLPLIVQRSLSSSADLIVTDFGLDSLSLASGQPVVVQFTVYNRGGGDADPFWVDLYVNPDPVPTRANQVWNEVCTRPCIGLAWPVDGLAAGRSVALTSAGGYSRPHSVWPGSLPAGTHDLYVYADTWNPGVTGGAVAESDETNNRAGLLGVVVGGSGPAEEGSWPPVDLPDRPVLPGE